jgi:hypothetical protein
MSCKGVTQRNVNNIPPVPKYLTILAAFLFGILVEKSIKNTAKLTERKIIPAAAQMRDGLSAPFTAFVPNRLLMKFRDQSNPIEFLSNIDPPG